MLELRINSIPVTVEKGTTILQAARKIGIRIPTLCNHPALVSDGNCRLCMVEATLRGRTKIVASCMYPISSEGVTVETETPRIQRARRFIIGLLLDRCPESDVLNDLAREFDAKPFGRLPETDPANLCINCGLCIRACEEEGNACLGFAWRGWDRKVTTPFEEPPENCLGCASCAECCPTDAIRVTESEGIRTIWNKEFRMIYCKVCGKPIGTEAQLRALGDKYPGDGLCDRCRKRAFASDFLPGKKGKKEEERKKSEE